jgi:hypothetical protein
MDTRQITAKRAGTLPRHLVFLNMLTRHAIASATRTVKKTSSFLTGFLAMLVAAGLFSFAGTAQAALITVAGTITVDADYGHSFKLGDTFVYGFTFDDATIDTDIQTYNAQFRNGVSAFSLTRSGSNTGTWDPASGTFDVSPFGNMILGANSNSITLQARGSGFPSINGDSFWDVGLTFGFSNPPYNFVDTGSGQTFAEMVGVSPLNFAAATSQFAEIRDDVFYGSPLLSASFTSPIPEPGSNLALLALGAGGLTLRRRLKRAA